MSEQIVSFVLDGNINRLEAMAKLKCMSTAFEDAEKIVKQLAFEELNKHSEKVLEINGVKFEKCEVGTSYLYSDALIDELELKLKERKELLKALKSPIEQVDPNTGETTTLYPATRKSTSSFKITLPK